MKFFIFFGVFLFSVVSLSLYYDIAYLLTKKPKLAALSLIIAVSLIVTNFVTRPSEFDYQRIVSNNSIEEGRKNK